MSSKLVKIKIERFQEGKSLAREIFLSLPLNDKMIRLALVGNEMDASLLERLKKRGVTSLFALPQTGDTSDPDTFPLYSQEPPRAQPAVTTIAQKNAAIEAKSEAPVVLATGQETEEETKITPTDAGPEETQKVSGSATTPDESEVLPPSLSSAEESTRVSAAESAPEEKNRFSSIGSVLEESRKIAGTESAADRPATVESFLAEEEKQRLRPSPEIEEQEHVLAGAHKALEEALRIAARAAEEAPTKERASLKGELEECMSMLRSAITEQGETITASATLALEDAIQRFNSSNEGDGSELNQSLKAALEEASEKFSLAHSAQRASGEFTKNTSEKFEMRFSSETGDASRKEEISFSPGHPDAQGKEKAKGFDSGAWPTELEAEEDGNSQTAFNAPGGRAAVYKDLPALAGRLSTYLAHSLGYVSLPYLSELALGVILNFSQSEDHQLDSSRCSPFIQFLLKKEASVSDSPLNDALEIVFLLEAYFKNPECDRTQKEFSQRVFQETIHSLKRRPSGLNPWNEIRWRQFIAKGPSRNAQSLCSKATAKAIKNSRGLEA
jgi:hypothetical protein